MKESTWFSLVAGLIALAVIALGALAVAFPNGPEPVAATHQVSGGNPTVYRNLSIALDPATGTFGYSTTQLSVPTGATVVFTITNHDPMIATLPTASDAQVVGTVGGTMQLTTGGVVSMLTQVSTSDVSHTFSISSGAYHLNVPIPPASPEGTPTVVSFSVTFPISGTFNWGCAVLCGPSDMMATDAMYGTLTVS